MAEKIIAVVPDELEIALKTLVDWIGAGRLPSSTEMQQHQGTNVGVTQDFHAALAKTSSTLGSLVETIRTQLQHQHDAIHQTVTELAAHDETIASDAKTILARFDSMASDAPASPAPASTPAAGNASAVAASKEF
jgi:hypothetical protein